MHRYFFLILVLLQCQMGLAHSHENQNSETSSVETCESSQPGEDVDMECIAKQLETTGLGGWVHAAVQDQMMLVFTWRRPGNFFINIQLPMSTKDEEVMKQLLTLRRHDQILVKGEFFDNKAPIQHINVTSVEVVKPYEGPEDNFDYDPKLIPEIATKTELIGKVHIVANGGAVLVIEVGDRVIPVFNQKPGLAAGLFRNDKIKIQYGMRLLPFRPSHLELNIKADQPIQVLERIAEGHGEEIVLKGPLVMFPKSPQIKFNVFALRTEDADGVSRNFTIVNFDDFDLFFAIREKLQEAWTKAQPTAEYDRNKYINRDIVLTVKGLKNVVSADQANPQIVPSAITDVSIEFL